MPKRTLSTEKGLSDTEKNSISEGHMFMTIMLLLNIEFKQKA